GRRTLLEASLGRGTDYAGGAPLLLGARLSLPAPRESGASVRAGGKPGPNAAVPDLSRCPRGTRPHERSVLPRARLVPQLRLRARAGTRSRLHRGPRVAGDLPVRPARRGRASRGGGGPRGGARSRRRRIRARVAAPLRAQPPRPILRPSRPCGRGLSR